MARVLKAWKADDVWSVGAMRGSGFLLVAAFATQPNGRRRPIHLQLTPEKARRMADSLRRHADIAEGKEPNP